MQLMRAGLLPLLVAAAPAVAAADGALTVRGVYYKEKATRVIQPMLDATFDAGDEAVVDAHVLVDAITSASAASGADQAAFSEQRYELGGGYTRTVGDLRLGGALRVSHEPDYDSVFAAGRVEWLLRDQATVLGATLGAGHDWITNEGAPTGAGLGGAPALAYTLDTLLASVSWTQVVGPNALVAFTYDLTHLDGFQANVYRTAVTAGGLVPERHPEQRTRHALAVSGRWFVPRTATTLIGAYRLYTDDWDLDAHTPEARVIQQAGDGVDVGLRYRYHRQGAAFFFAPSYPSADEEFLTDDVKLSAFTTHTLAVKLGVAGRVLGLAGALEDARGELILEYVAQANRFGNAAVAHAALTLPFTY
jgi:hypothetical protein